MRAINAVWRPTTGTTTRCMRHLAAQARVAGGTLKRVSLELGGNSPFIVLEDADIEAAAGCGAWGSFLHQGQICMASTRHLVHESIAKEYVAALTSHAEKLVVGDPSNGQVHAQAESP